MNRLLAQFMQDVHMTGPVCSDVKTLLIHHGCTNTARHCRLVALQAEQLATQFGADTTRAQTAGWLHDVSAVFPVAQRVPIAKELGVEVLLEEESAPMLLHQKLSAVVAKGLFGIADSAILDAIECHTTLKANPSTLDKVIFVADKVAWDQPGTPPYLGKVRRALERSLDEAVLCYLEYLWQRRADLAAVHPWFVQAYHAYQNKQNNQPGNASQPNM